MRTGNLGKMLSIDARGRFGYSGAFGRLALGYNRFGWYNLYAGVYQKRYFYGKPYISRSRITWGGNPQTEKQQLWRGVFADGKIAYNALTEGGEKFYRLWGATTGLTAYNKFMSEYLKDHKNVLD
jgi:hypothetical protein